MLLQFTEPVITICRSLLELTAPTSVPMMEIIQNIAVFRSFNTQVFECHHDEVKQTLEFDFLLKLEGIRDVITIQRASYYNLPQFITIYRASYYNLLQFTTIYRANYYNLLQFVRINGVCL